MYIWQMTKHVDNGIHAYMEQGKGRIMCTDWDIVNTRDFDYLNEMWKKEEEQFKSKTLMLKSKRLGEILISDIEIPSLELTKPSKQVFPKRFTFNPSSEWRAHY